MPVRKKNRKNRYKKKKSILSIFFRYILYSFLCGIAAVVCTVCYFAKDIPDLQNLKTAIRNPSVVMQTYDGAIIGSYGDLYEDVMMVEELPHHVPEAFMAIEDKRFFYHFGIDFIGFFRAIYKNCISGKVVEGGSTITQQLAKNILIGEGVISHYDKSVARKVKELLLSIWLEHKFNKSQIMMLYLNRVYFGAGTYGIDAASRKYFNKQAKNLNVYESAVLAGILKAPSKYSPTNSAKNAKERTHIVLKAMEEQKFIKNADKIEKQYSETAFSNGLKSQNSYMYFCDFIYDQAKKILGDIEDDIVIVTTFDIAKQKAAEEAVKFYADTEFANYKISQVSLLSTGRDGRIDAMIGGLDYTTTQFNRVTQALRMSGSAFKIFVYGAAIEMGYQLSDTFSDEPVTIAGWTAKNYKYKSRGSMSILDAFTHSINSVCIRLAQQIGLKKVVNFANKLGISNVSQHDMSVAIGTTALTLKDLTCAYASFMDGMPIWPYGILEIRTKSGDILYSREKSTTKKKILDDETLTDCRKLLRSVIENGTGRAANVDHNVFGKTGSNGDDDAWFLGFYDPEENPTNGFTIGIWVGNDNNNKKMTKNSTGGRIPARIASRFIKSVLNDNKQKTIETAPKEEEYIEDGDEIIEQDSENADGLDAILDNLG